MSQLSVEPPLRSCGIGTILIEALEQRAIDRGHVQVQLGIDVNKSRPQALYERLGYRVVGQGHGAWDEERPWTVKFSDTRRQSRSWGNNSHESSSPGGLASRSLLSRLRAGAVPLISLWFPRSPFTCQLDS